MKDKHIRIRIEQCRLLATASPCPRGQVGALLLDPARNVVLADGYNGGPRGGIGPLCGGNVCLRDLQGIPSGEHVEVGCIHAEMNVVCNAAANGIPTRGAWMIVTCAPCLMCAKLIHQAGISKVLIAANDYPVVSGTQYLTAHGVTVEWRK